jgi:hypothetical protein
MPRVGQLIPASPRFYAIFCSKGEPHSIWWTSPVIGWKEDDDGGPVTPVPAYSHDFLDLMAGILCPDGSGEVWGRGDFESINEFRREFLKPGDKLAKRLGGDVALNDTPPEQGGPLIPHSFDPIPGAVPVSIEQLQKFSTEIITKRPLLREKLLGIVASFATNRGAACQNWKDMSETQRVEAWRKLEALYVDDPSEVR